MILKLLGLHLQEALDTADLKWLATYYLGAKDHAGVIHVYEHERTQNIIDDIFLKLEGSNITIRYAVFVDPTDWPERTFDLTDPESIDKITETLCESIKHTYHTEHRGLFR